MGERARVLLIAEACNPEWTSVPLVGWNWYNALRRKADITLVTQVRNRPALLRHTSEPAEIAFVDTEKLASPCYRVARMLTRGGELGWTTQQAAMWLPYLYFEKLVYQRFRDDLRAGRYDVVHRLTPLSPAYASPMASWVDVPFILGPLNGGLPWPKGTARTRLAEMEFLSFVRNGYRWLPYVSSTYRRAAAVIAGSRHTQKEISRTFGLDCHYMPENGVDPRRFHPNGRIPPSQVHPFRILFAGRLVPLKRTGTILRAVGGSPVLRETCRITIIGQGPQRQELEQLAKTLGIAHSVEWLGHVPQTDLRTFFCESSVMVLPSLKEFGGAVVLEAMACGLPCIVLDYGGPAEFVSSETGVKLPMRQPDDLVGDLSGALERLVNARKTLDMMSKRCVQYTHDNFSWDRKAQQMMTIYEPQLR